MTAVVSRDASTTRCAIPVALSSVCEVSSYGRPIEKRSMTALRIDRHSLCTAYPFASAKVWSAFQLRFKIGNDDSSMVRWPKPYAEPYQAPKRARTLAKTSTMDNHAADLFVPQLRITQLDTGTAVHR